MTSLADPRRVVGVEICVDEIDDLVAARIDGPREDPTVRCESRALVVTLRHGGILSTTAMATIVNPAFQLEDCGVHGFKACRTDGDTNPSRRKSVTDSSRSWPTCDAHSSFATWKRFCSSSK